MPSLSGTVALVAGATRGAGRGIAWTLGEAGATVYCSGRSTRARPAPGRRPETIEETAEGVTRRGGRGFPAAVDHTRPDEVEALVARIRDEQGRLDLLVNDVWGGDELVEWGKPFWELSLERGFLLLQRALHSHIITARLAVPLMLPGKRGLVIEVGDGDGYWYRQNLLFDLVKTSVLRLAFGMAEELRPHGLTALALTPGFLRSEAMLDHFGVTEATWRDGVAKDPHFAQSETPFYTGRAVAALAADPGIAAKSGRSFNTGALAREYGFRDVDGSQPDWMGYALREIPHLFADPFLAR